MIAPTNQNGSAGANLALSPSSSCKKITLIASGILLIGGLALLGVSTGWFSQLGISPISSPNLVGKICSITGLVGLGGSIMVHYWPKKETNSSSEIDSVGTKLPSVDESPAKKTPHSSGSNSIGNTSQKETILEDVFFSFTRERFYERTPKNMRDVSGSWEKDKKRILEMAKNTQEREAVRFERLDENGEEKVYEATKFGNGVNFKQQANPQ